ncbi:AAA family ATPase [Pseudomonas sp. FSL R10-0765]|uniref:AAA family ATPase n=1 Tax=Pseudomonas sp. FSL R10-0765 TaxID=2662195 RepID=UPI003531F0CF
MESVEYPTSELTQLTSDLKALLIENFNFIETKISTPSMVITLSSTSSLIEEINRLIELEQVRIDAFNQKVREKKKHLNIINDRFWHCYRDACADLVNDTQPKLEVLKLQRSEKRDVVQQIRTHINVQRQVIVDSRSKITNIDQSVENINRWLGLLGLHGFELLREEGQIPQYRLQRPQSQDKVFKSLSEGEKTLISFLYFLEVCNGELDAQSTKQKSQRIVVIDDPISSLSHNYIYDVASLIRRHVLLPSNRFKQVIVMTHNLFFYHELMKLVEDDKRENEMALFKVSKATHSAIQTLSKRDIKNDYHAFWHTIKDALEGKASPALIPNMMRNILEYYFSFVQRKDKLWKVIDELSEQNPDFRALYRYINRESHSDPVNLTEFGDIDPKQYLEQFKKIFVVTDFEEHYNLMMA